MSLPLDGQTPYREVIEAVAIRGRSNDLVQVRQVLTTAIIAFSTVHKGGGGGGRRKKKERKKEGQKERKERKNEEEKERMKE